MFFFLIKKKNFLARAFCLPGRLSHGAWEWEAARGGLPVVSLLSLLLEAILFDSPLPPG